METVSPGFYSIDFVPFFRTEIKVDTKKKIQKLAQKIELRKWHKNRKKKIVTKLYQKFWKIETS